jgi:NADPH:quinone reductase-like Zn-dependent oxidoreductase
LVAVGGLIAGRSVLISAASSSVGLAAIQIATLLGARPIALTRTSAKAQALFAHGAIAVVATEEQDVITEVHRHSGGVGGNLVFDPIGGPSFSLLAKSAADGGTLVLYGALDQRPTVVPPFDVFARDLTIRGLALPALMRDGQKLAAMKRFVSAGLASGALWPTIARTFAFDHIADAHRFIEAGEQIGKIVVTV